MAFFQPTFTNGTIINPGLQSQSFVQGLSYFYLTATTFTISAGSCRAYQNNNQMTLLSPFTVDLATIGPGGCFPVAAATAAPTNDTTFGIYMIGDSTGTQATVGGHAPSIVVATGDNFLPTGYDIWCRIGTVYIAGGTNNQIFMTQTGFGSSRSYLLQDTFVIANTASATYVEIDLSDTDNPCNPALNEFAQLYVLYTPNNAGNNLSFAPYGTPGLSNPPYRVRAQNAAIIQGADLTVQTGVVAGVPTIYYNCDAADTVVIRLAGWTESVGIQAI